MADIWRLMPSIDNPHFPPPTLLISLGDGSAIEMTEQMLADAIRTATPSMAVMLRGFAPKLRFALIQQAQEKR